MWDLRKELLVRMITATKNMGENVQEAIPEDYLGCEVELGWDCATTPVLNIHDR